MFSNLIESGSHAADLKRKGRFFLGTTLFYAVLLCATGIGSIYAYNVRLDDSAEYEVLALMRFPPAEAREETPRRAEPRPASAPARANQITTRIEIAEQTPYHGDRIASPTAREVRPGTAVALGRFDSDAAVPAGPVGPFVPGAPQSAPGNAGPVVADPVETPPPTPRPTPAAPAPTPKQETGPVRLSSSVITSKVIDKPAPPYPPIAKAAGVEGAVAVQILVDEQGRVISAKATSGNPLLQQAAVQAAYRARFTPTLLGNQPVKVSGIITYNFLLR